METFKNICMALVCGFILTALSIKLGSSFLDTFLQNNLIMLLIALLAIHITTLSVIMTKLKELSDKYGQSFSNTIKEMRISLYEHIVLIVLGLVVLILKESTVLDSFICNWGNACAILLSSILIYSLVILYDTGKSVFEIINFEEKK